MKNLLDPSKLVSSNLGSYKKRHRSVSVRRVCYELNEKSRIHQGESCHPNPESNFAIKNRGYKPLLQKITIPFPEEIHVDVGVSSLYPFLFLLLKQQKPGNLYASQKRFGCMLFKCVFMGKGSEFACHTPVSDAKITGFGV